jgi:hypothetical protein
MTNYPASPFVPMSLPPTDTAGTVALVWFGFVFRTKPGRAKGGKRTERPREGFLITDHETVVNGPKGGFGGFGFWDQPRSGPGHLRLYCGTTLHLPNLGNLLSPTTLNIISQSIPKGPAEIEPLSIADSRRRRCRAQATTNPLRPPSSGWTLIYIGTRKVITTLMPLFIASHSASHAPSQR